MIGLILFLYLIGLLINFVLLSVFDVTDGRLLFAFGSWVTLFVILFDILKLLQEKETMNSLRNFLRKERKVVKVLYMVIRNLIII